MNPRANIGRRWPGPRSRDCKPVPITERSASTLVIEQKPWLEAFVGIAFVAAGAWAFFGGERVFGGGFMLAGAVIIAAFANTVTSRFDRTTGQFTQVKKGLVRRKALTHPLDQIASVRVQAGNSTADSPSQTYRVALVLRSRERVHIGSGASSGKAGKERLAAEIRSFLNLSDAPQQPPSFGEMAGAIFDAATQRAKND